MLNILKERVSLLENEIKKKDNVIDFLMKKLVIGNNRQMFNDVVSTDNSFINVNDSVISNNDSLNEDNSNDNKDKNIVKRKAIVLRDSLFNGINERGLFKDFNVKVNNIPGGTSETVLDKIDVKCKTRSLKKGKKCIDRNVVATNARPKNYCSQKKLDYIENTNIKEEHLGVKKLHLNKRVALC